MYTSGSSGIPKGVLVEHRTIVNSLLWRKNNYKYAPGYVSLQIPPYFFDSSVTDIFTPLMGGARLVLITGADRSNLAALGKIISRNKVSHFIVVPVFYNILLEEIAEDLTSLQMICCAGENFPDELIRKHFERLPRVRIFNEYGPTENSVNSTGYELTPHSPKALIGKPAGNISVYILDRYLNVCPIGVMGEMCLSGGSVARGYLNSPELTAEKFITIQLNKSFAGGQGDPRRGQPITPGLREIKAKSPAIANKTLNASPRSGVFQKSPLVAEGKKTYKTGDMARWLPDGNLEFLGRLDSQVKIRGIRVETGEIENCLMRHEDIKEALVQVRQDESGSNYLCAYIVPHSQARSAFEPGLLKEYLSRLLPNYMVPAYFLELEKIPLTPNGKIDTKALPDPGGEAVETYTAPRTEIEKQLAEIWQGVIGRDNIGTNDNFFHIGGDSIKSIQIMSRMNSAGYKLDMKDLFRYPVIAELAPHVEKLLRIPDQSAVTGVIPLTPMQRIFFNAGHSEAFHYNQAVMFYAPRGFDKEVVKKVFSRLQEHHDALRITYEINPESGSVVQTAHGLDFPLSLDEYDLRNRENSLEELETKINEIHAGMDLEKGPLLKLGLFHLENGDRLLIALHHLIIDGISWRILFEDIETLYTGYAAGEQPALPAKSDSFKHWAEKLQEYAGSKTFLKEKSYWARLESQTVPDLAKDFPVQENYTADARSITFSLEEEETGLLLNEVNKVYNTEINDILLTALALALKKSFAPEQVLIALEGHGREDILEDMNISRTVGWFTTEYPVLLDVSYAGDPGRQVKEVKETLRQIPHKGIGYGILKYLTGAEYKEDIEFKLKPQIIFNYLGQFDADVEQISSFKMAAEPVGNTQGPGNRREYDLEINGMTAGNRLSMTLSYNKTHFKTDTVKALAGFFESELKQLIAFCSGQENIEHTPSDFTYKGLPIGTIDRLMVSYPDVEDIYTLTPMQEGMLFHALVDDSSASYFEQTSYRLQGELDTGLVEKSLSTLVQRHHVLRTAFVHKDIERPIQIVLKNRRVDFSYEDISSLSSREEKENFVREFKAKDKGHSFDLSKDVLMRVAVFRLEQTEYEITWSFFHILMDGWCVGILNSEFFEIYSAYLGNRPHRLPQTKPFSTYTQWLEKQDREASAAYWAGYLDAFAEQTGVPKTTPVTKKEEQPGYRNRKSFFELDEEKTAELNKLAAGSHVTLNILTQALWGIVLGKYNGKEDVVFGSVVSGRPFELAGVEAMVGLFINTIPVRIRFAGEMKFSQLLKRVQEEAIAAEPHHYHPLADIQSAGALKQNLIDHIFIFENYPIAEQIEGYGSGKNKSSESSFILTGVEIFEQTNYDFNILLMGTNRLKITFQYNENVYGADFIERLAGHFREAFQQVLRDKDLEIRALTLLSEEEKNRLLYEFNDTSAAYPKEKAIHELFAQQVEKTPDYIAVTGSSLEAGTGQGLQISYRELHEKSSRLAYELMEKGVESDTIVGILVERHVEMITGLLGILKAGGAYMPIDPVYPEDRKEYMVRESAAKILLTSRNLYEEKVAAETKYPPVEAIYLDPVPAQENREKKRPAELAGRSGSHREAGRLAYVIYTSGSTGKPKGVMIEHHNVVNFIYGVDERIPFLPRETILGVTTISFDIFVLETYLPLAKGLKIILADSRQQGEPTALAELIVKHNVKMLQFTPSRLKMLQLADEDLKGLRHAAELMVGGEAFPTDLFKEVKQRFKGKIHNMYGPTETTVWSTIKDLTEAGKIDIGTPILNTQVYILDRNYSLQPIGVTGELYIGGDGLARGYLNRPELTAEKFQLDFYESNKSYRTYKTGDLARRQPDGSIEFLGRVDQQVKIRGFRVELGEIENRLKEYPGIKEAVVIDRENSGRQYLCAYFTAPVQVQEILPVQALKEHLEGELPNYMIPACFVKIDEIPLTPNGKTDRSKLPQPSESDFHTGGTYKAPETGIQKTIAGIWKEVLGREKVGIHDNFFDLGGNSLDFVKVSSRLKENLNREIPVVTLFTYPTISTLERYLSGKGEEMSQQETAERSELIDEGIDFMSQMLNELDEEN